MGNIKEEGEELVFRPSLENVIYQGLTLHRQLGEINDQEYPPEAFEIRDLLLLLQEHISKELVKPGAFENPSENKRLRELARNLHEIHSFVQYLRASSSQRTPSGVQLALTELTKQFFPDKNGKPICLVLPQWDYNFQCVPLSRRLEQMFTIGGIDPQKSLRVDKKELLVAALWQRKYGKEETNPATRPFPKQISILSFAALETDNPLLYPLLAHELGHAIDFSYPQHLCGSKELNEVWETLSPESKSASSTAGGEKNQATKKEPTPSAAGGEKDQAQQWRAYICLRELLADLLAVRMMGISYFITQAEGLKTLFKKWPGPTILESGYPGIRFRLSVTFAHLKLLPESVNPISFLKQQGEKGKYLLNYLEQLANKLENPGTLSTASITPDQESGSENDMLLETTIRKAIPILHKIAAGEISEDRCAKLSESLFERIENIRRELPPSRNKEDRHAFCEILTAGWAYQLEIGRKKEATLETEEKWKEYQKTCRLIVKAIELIPVCLSNEVLAEKEGTPEEDAKIRVARGVLGEPSILNRIQRPVKDALSINIIPLVNFPKSLNCVSLDVHLGNWFSIARRARINYLKLGEPSSEQLMATMVREKIFVKHNQTLIIHPGDLVLGVTLEFVALPADLMAYVEGKSRIGRMGLIIATASKIDPGFHGVIVLELANAGTVPLEVEPGDLIAQLVFHTLEEPLPDNLLYKKEYYCQTKL